jgi:hypothetical protein
MLMLNQIDRASSASALSGTQLAAITFVGFGTGAALDSLGNTSPAAIPEPAGLAGSLGVAALITAGRRRRRRAISIHD